MRMHGHGAHDDMSYVPTELFESWAARDPIETLRAAAERARASTSRRIRAVGARGDRARDRVGSRSADARPGDRRGAACSRPRTRLWATAGRRGRAGRRAGRPAMPELTYLEAISDGLREEMRYDDSVFCLGEDIGAFGGAFKVTDGFIEEFGADRVWDTPLAESAIVGAAVGAAVEGLRPVCEMQFADFIACGFDQLVNVAAKMHYRQGLAVPMVVAAALGRRLLRRSVPLAEPRGVVPAGAGPEGGGAVERRGRQGAAGRRDPRPQSGPVPGAQAPLPAREGRGARGPLRDDTRRGAHRSGGHRPHGDHLRRDGAARRSRRPRTSTALRSR